ncbi:NUDIX domain-containing protein [Streptomyces sp. NPDC055210]
MDDGEHRGPWLRHSRTRLHAASHLTAYRDEVTLPDGRAGHYDWVDVADQVRVAALVDGCLLVVEQYHYLSGPMWQLPGGSVEPDDEDSGTAARRELAEETGYFGGDWSKQGAPQPLPALTPARVHLWRATGLTPGTATPDPFETDLRIHHIPLEEALSAVRDGRIACAASAALVLAVALEDDSARR